MHVVRLDAMNEAQATGGQRAALWLGFLGGPIAWLLQFTTNYMLVTVACSTGKRWPLYVTNLVFLALAAAAGITAAIEWGRRKPGVPPDELSYHRTRFMGIVGVLSSALFFTLIVFQGVPILIFDPCET